jgi:hypothetical protein
MADLGTMSEEIDDVEYGELVEEKDGIKTVIHKKRALESDSD